MWSQEIQLGRHNQRNRGDPRSLIRGLSGWSWWGFHKTPDKNRDSLILHRLGVSIRESEEMTTSQVECRPTNTWTVCDLIPNTFAVAIILIKLRDLTHPQMIPEQPLSINLPALHSTPCAQCQHGEESIDKEFDPGVICLHYTIFSRTMTFSLLSHHKTFKCSQVWHSVWGAQSVWARNVMCGRGEGGSLVTMCPEQNQIGGTFDE